MASPSILNLTPGIQDYAWGKKGSSSLAAQLATVSIPDFKIDENKTYAEVSSPALALAVMITRRQIDGEALADPSS